MLAAWEPRHWEKSHFNPLPPFPQLLKRANGSRKAGMINLFTSVKQLEGLCQRRATVVSHVAPRLPGGDRTNAAAHFYTHLHLLTCLGTR